MSTLKVEPKNQAHHSGVRVTFLPINEIEIWWVQNGRIGCTAGTKEWFVTETGWQSEDGWTDTEAQAIIDAVYGFQFQATELEAEWAPPSDLEMAVVAGTDSAAEQEPEPVS